MSSEQNSCKNLELLELDEVPITQKEYDKIISIQSNILGMVADNEESDVVLNTLCRLAEKLLPNAVASIMLLDPKSNSLSVLSAPSVPEAGHKALEKLKPGKGAGSCGNAIFQNEAQYVVDTFEDERWLDLRELAHDFNLCACWSMPVKDENAQPIATFALSSFEQRSPSNFHKKLLETGAKIISIVLKNIKKDQKLKLFSLATQNASEGIVITDEHNTIIEVNQAFKDIYKYDERDIIGKNPSFLSSRKQSKNFYDEMWKSLNETSKWAGEIVNVNAEGKEITQWLSISVLELPHHKKNYLGIFTNLTELKQAKIQIEEMAFIDSLTGLKNKSKLEHMLESYKNPVTLILLNINNFSYINTAYGYEIGDAILQDVAEVLKNNFGKHHTFRINSDEFALLYETDIDIKKVVSEIQKYFYGSTIMVKDLTFNISFTYGGVYVDKNVLRDAAIALKKAKQNGKNNLFIYNHKDDVALNDQNKENFFESNRLLHSALLEDRIVPYYQGIRNNRTGKIIKFEVLARIEDFDKVISPIAFLEAAKLSGLLLEITKAIIDKSFYEMAQNDYTFSINITEEDLNQHYLKIFLLEKVKHYNIKPNRIVLEVLEGISATGKINHIDQLKSLKECGFKIAIDDFGSEYSNFERILDMDIDFLKIDARYIKNIDTDPKSYEITRAISFFAKNANIPVIAEFVHSQSIQEKLEELDIEFSQGYLFSEPSPQPIEK
ncbi:sensor domain-containing diguanylate cyclase [Sulfurimonas marina]|uniref:EAL domain-containing protein n=1 Tax=Sulfurimonas marina TaxID=2590551 RepID=A0A7M1AYA7_9BACT|nr:EAL domain-containing protein [Sulfurimonas marina]QOP41538.1 EAL domain-containing protein [Sulfurimonas marina]